MMRVNTCRDCRCYSGSECRGNFPSMDGWPPTRPDDFCARFQVSAQMRDKQAQQVLVCITAGRCTYKDLALATGLSRRDMIVATNSLSQQGEINIYAQGGKKTRFELAGERARLLG